MRRSGILCVQVNDVRLEASWRYCLKKLEQSYVRAINSGADTAISSAIAIVQCEGLHNIMFRCDHCRRSLGLIVHRYWRMRFCSAACVERYKQRLQTETKAKISHLWAA